MTPQHGGDQRAFDLGDHAVIKRPVLQSPRLLAREPVQPRLDGRVDRDVAGERRG
jgi:hypothetical protein